MDQIILDILSIVIGGGGLFIVLTKYNVSETRRNFYGRIQVFKEKASIIDDVMTPIFTTLSILGLLTLIIKDIYSDVIPERLYTQEYYWAVLVASLAGTLLLIFILSWIGKAVARKKWLPLAIDGYKESFDLVMKNNMLNENPARAAEIIEIMEKALDIESKNKDLNARFDTLKPFFKDLTGSR